MNFFWKILVAIVAVKTLGEIQKEGIKWQKK